MLLLDEIEKAHPDVFNILLQILEDGRLTDAQGRTVDFRNAIVIMTSNIGAAEISKNTSIGFTVSDETGMSYDDMKNRIMGDLKKVFRPEFLNRIDEVIVFHKRPTGSRPGPGRGSHAQAQLHRHRAHPARAAARGGGARRAGPRVARHHDRARPLPGRPHRRLR